MSAPDFAAIIAHATFNVSLLTSTEAHRAALGGIAAKVPELCQTCAGESVIYDLRCDNCGGSASLPLGMTCENHHAKPQPCPDCPTIGQLLAIGAAAWNAIAERDAAYARRESLTTANILAINAISAAVKAVQP